MIRSFVSGVSTSVGKTFITRGVARSLARRGQITIALKPIETGVTGEPLDAAALARACGQSALAGAAGFYRARPPLAPYAVTLETGAAPPDLESLTHRIQQLAAGADALLVEGAGGLLVPVDAERTIADLAAALALPLWVVARDELGVLSSVLTAVESARARKLHVAAVILSAHARSPDDPSTRTNAAILAQRLSLPVISFPSCADDDDALADAAERAGLLELLTEA